MTRADRHWLVQVILVLALLLGGWLAFDGTRALVAGDYVTPSTGEYAGQLGPWSRVVSAVGIEPRSTFMKSVHLLLGAAWITSAALFALGFARARAGMVACAVLSLWYLPFGTLIAVVLIVLLHVGPVRRGSPRQSDDR